MFMLFAPLYSVNVYLSAEPQTIRLMQYRTFAIELPSLW